MEVILFIGVVIVILMLNNSKNSINRQFQSLQSNFDTLFSDFRRLENEIRQLKELALPPDEAPALVKAPLEIVETNLPPVVEIAAVTIQPPLADLPISEPEPVVEQHPVTPSPHVIEEREKISFWEKYPDLEKFIGENLINKIGIAILVLGMGFFLKYAIDKNWINEIGRTCIGLVTGGILIGIAHKMRKAYPAFGSVLIGGGLAILYFSITIAYHQYHLFGQTPAFIIMIALTAATVFLSVLYNRIELAVFAILGGFGAPFLVSSGEGNFIILFTYLLILNTGMLVLAYYKKWNLLNQISFVLTVIIYGGWLHTKVLDPAIPAPKPYMGALIFATLFYFIFFLMNIINNLKEKVRFSAREIGQLLSNTALYFSAGMLILGSFNDGIFKGAFTIFLALVNFTFAFLLYKNDKVDRNLVYLLVGLVLTFVSLAAPVQLDGNYITLFWALESVLLVWLAYKSGLGFLRDASVLLVGLTIISLVMDWGNIYFYPSSARYTQVLFPFFNKGFITTLIAVCGLTGYSYLMNSYFKSDKILFFAASEYINVLHIGIFLLAYAGIQLELSHQARAHFPDLRIIILGGYNYVIAILLMHAVKNKPMEPQIVIQVFTIVLIAFYPLVFNAEVMGIRTNYLTAPDASLTGFLSHYLLSALMLFTMYTSYVSLSRMHLTTITKGVVQTGIIIMLVYFTSAELDHILVLTRFGEGNTVETILSSSHKVGYAILWGVCSFILIYLGMKWKSKTVRIASLALFGITLLKLFLFDIRGLSEGGKIAAFITLGVILLVVSFMYQKLKTLILADEAKQGTEKDQPDTGQS